MPAMAKRRRRKGKSQRRRKDWHQRYRSGEDFDHAPTGRQRIGEKAVKIPAYRLEAQEENLDALPRAEGLVVAMFRGGAIVRVERRDLLCGIAKAFRAPEGATALAVGDRVTVALTEHADEAASGDKDRADGMVVARELRETVLSRPRPRSDKRRDEYDDEPFEKVIAANMDLLLIVAATRQLALRPGMIDRFLIIAERGELEPVLVVNKVDLAEPNAEAVAVFEDLGLDIHRVSALKRECLEPLAQKLNGRRSVLAGASGVGKSTLVNALVPEAEIATRSVRAKDERGRHTTSQAVVYELPGGGVLVDTPGVRELGIHIDRYELPWYFPEFEALAWGCKFRDCTHTHEPACTIRQAVEEERIPRRRYESYLRILEAVDE